MAKLRSRARIVIGGVLAAGALLAGIGLMSLRRKPSLTVAFGAEFLTRPDGYEGLSRHYGFRFESEPRQMMDGLMYKALSVGSVDVIDAFTTDGRILAYDLVILEDDRHFFPPYHAAPLIRGESLALHPELKTVLNTLAGRITDADMRRMNHEVDEEGKTAHAVARAFLDEQGLLGSHEATGKAGTAPIVVGSKEFTEQEILGEMLALLIESHTDIPVTRKLNLGGTIICFNALQAGDLDVYPEYTGTGLVNILKRDTVSDPDAVYEIVCQAFRDQYGLIWLKPFGFNNSYALAMRKDHARRLGIRTISDLARYMKRSP